MRVSHAPWTEAADIAEPVTPLLAWQYHLHFREWLDVLAARTGLTFNTPRTLIWNSRKTYLRDVAHIAPIVPTHFADTLTADHLAAARDAFGTHDLVIKPAIGASAFGLSRGGAGAIGQTDVLIQPFVTSIQDEGEWSLFYFGGHFCHAVRKRPARGDFRVQMELGGATEPASPAPELLDVAQAALTAAPDPVDYARVDLVRLDDGWAVTELELVEPELFLRYHPDAPHTFAAAIKARLKAFEDSR